MAQKKKKKKEPTLATLGEFPLIAQLTSSLPRDPSVIHGVGDDCAVIKLSWNAYELCATDMLIEDVHFKRKELTPQAIGYKAMARNLSDIAAMGGEPTYALVALALPPALPVRYARAIYEGLKKSARDFDVIIIGGDTAKHTKIVITVTILGEVEKQRLIVRGGARPKDALFVTGSLGGSRLKKHYSFKPRIDEARFISSVCPVHAMIDISDGLVQDLFHILKASDVGARLIADALPISKDAFSLARNKPKKALEHALYDGEDFELLFTVPEKRKDDLVRKWQKNMRTPLTCIGSITEKKKCVIEDSAGVERELTRKGYTHF